MAQFTVDIPNGPLLTRFGQIALVNWHTRHDNDVPLPSTPTAVAAGKEMIVNYIKDVLQQDSVNTAAATAQATIEAARAQAKTDTAAIV